MKQVKYIIDLLAAQNTVLRGQGIRITFKFVMDECSLTRLMMYTREADWPHTSTTWGGLETRDVSVIVQYRSGLDLDSVTLKNLHNLSVSVSSF